MKRPRQKRFSLKVKIILSIATAFIAVTSYMHFFVNPIIITSATARVQAMTVNAIHRAISNLGGIGVNRELTKITHDNNGKITSVSANTMQINGMASEITTMAKGYIDMAATRGLTIPLGTFSGLPIMTGKGPNVELRVIPIGALKVSFDSTFVQAGFNQTRHRIVLQVTTMMTLIMPMASRSINVEVQALLCENIIVGDVPEFLWTR